MRQVSNAVTSVPGYPRRVALRSGISVPWAQHLKPLNPEPYTLILNLKLQPIIPLMTDAR